MHPLDMVNYITSAMNVSTHMLSAWLDVSKKTLDNWCLNDAVITTEIDPKLSRLVKTYVCVKLAEYGGVFGKQLISLFNEPLTDDGESIWCWIVDRPDEDGFPLVAFDDAIHKFIGDSYGD